MSIKVKVCCISSVEEAEIALKTKPYALGLVGPMPSGPGTISVQEAADICKFVDDRVFTFYLTSKTSFGEIAQEYNQVLSSHIQLTDHISAKTRELLKAAFPETKLVQVVHVIDSTSILAAQDLAENSDYLLLDSGAPDKKVKELGGTGRTHNWNVSRQIVEESQIPVFLAGGLKPENISSAIETVKPYGVDLCSGIRSKGHLDPLKMNSFFSKV